MAAPITLATSERLPQLVTMSARAFLGEAIFRWAAGEVDDPLAACEAGFAVEHTVAIDLGCLWEAGDALGAAGWFGPEVYGVYCERCRSAALDGVGVAAYATDGGHRWQMLYDCVDSHAPARPAWTLDTISVDPAGQRAGIGSALIAHGLALARESGCLATLETCRGELLGYYARFGFEVTSEDDLPENGPHLWFMVA